MPNPLKLGCNFSLGNWVDDTKKQGKLEIDFHGCLLQTHPTSSSLLTSKVVPTIITLESPGYSAASCHFQFLELFLSSSKMKKFYVFKFIYKMF